MSAEKRTVAFSIRLTEEENELLDRIAKETFRKKPDVIRLAINRFFEESTKREEVDQ